MDPELQQHFIPQTRRPIPLPKDFYKLIVDRNPPDGVPLSDLVQIDASRENEKEISKIAEEIVDKNQAAIDEASRRLACTSFSGQPGAIFDNLVPVDFDEATFVREAEDRREQQRQASMRSARRSAP